MKKRLVALVAVIMSIFLGFSALTGCNIISIDNDRDMKQVVATVNIGNEGAKTDEIIKQDVIMMYLNYGYSLSQNYSQSQIFEIIISQLINNRILIQSAMQAFEEDASFVKNSAKEKWDVERYLTTDDVMDGNEIKELSDIHEAEYQAIKSINDLIASYDENVEEKVGDALTEEARTIPTNAANKELSAKEKNDYIGKGIDTGATDPDRRKAYNNVLKLLEDNSLLGDDFKTDIKESTYYKELIVSSEESILIEKYEDMLKAEARSKVSYELLSKKYEEMYEGQLNDYGNNETAFSEALSSATKDNPIIYTPFGGYVYVQNLLLGASEEQTAALNKVKEETTDTKEIAEKRRTILQGTTAKDLRSTWILNGYDFDYDATNKTGKFTGDYAFLENSLGFNGKVTELKAKTDTEAAEYRIDSVEEIKLDDFIAEFIDGYLYGGAGTAQSDSNPSVYKKVKVDAEPANYQDKINELLFAFSTDPGSLNTNKGYVVAPIPELGGSETYMQEFADAARALIDLGGFSYIVAATDYGYHFMFLSEVVGANPAYATLKGYLGWESLNDEETEDAIKDILADWENADEESYLYKFIEMYANADAEVSKIESALFNKYANDGKSVVKYKDAYADLLG